MTRDWTSFRLLGPDQHAHRHDWPASATPPVAHPGPAGTTGLSAASHHLALDLLATGLPAAEHLRAAATHLYLLADLLRADIRAAFLFTGWQRWSAGLTPAARVALGELAQQEAVHLLRSVAQASGHTPWQRHGERLRTAATELRDEPQLPYLLFDHAQSTHERLGIDAATQAVAARALRTALATGAVVPVPVRQPLPAAA
ncbi:hypothetical protein [Catellatospora vulcania]|uniref:hypothetical protein n=1 Tax=Catellatospora vulcania TaxID=1460450 RepID=UPI0012D45B0F|nr:hypothetical protein [Catellatospora vulcania]